jgi:hypothetical protein
VYRFKDADEAGRGSQIVDGRVHPIGYSGVSVFYFRDDEKRVEYRMGRQVQLLSTAVVRLLSNHAGK